MYTSRCVFMKYVRHHAYLDESSFERDRTKHEAMQTHHQSAYIYVFVVICMSEDSIWAG